MDNRRCYKRYGLVTYETSSDSVIEDVSSQVKGTRKKKKGGGGGGEEDKGRKRQIQE